MNQEIDASSTSKKLSTLFDYIDDKAVFELQKQADDEIGEIEVCACIKVSVSSGRRCSPIVIFVSQQNNNNNVESVCIAHNHVKVAVIHHHRAGSAARGCNVHFIR